MTALKSHSVLKSLGSKQRTIWLAVASAFLGMAVLSAGIGTISASAQAQNSPNNRGPGWHWNQRDFWQPGWMNRPMWRQRGRTGDMRARMQRHWTFMHSDLATKYQGIRSNVPNNAATIAAGGKLYTNHCASCHGKTGMGDGEAGKTLSPSPALLAFMIQRPMAVDEFLLWSIAEGGAQFKTSMPAYKDVLKREEIWKIIAYMRAGFPKVTNSSKSK